MPLRLGKYDASASEEDRKVLLKAVAGISTDMDAIIPSDMNIEFVQGLTSGSSNNNIYQSLIEWLDSQVSKAILGQTMTTDDGASLSQAQVHDKVRTDILMSDARQLANTIAKQLIQPYIDINYGAQEIYPKFELLKEEKEDVTALVDNITKLVPFGLTVSQTEVRSKLGLKEPTEDEAVLKQQEITGFGAMNSTQSIGNARALNAIDREGAFDPELELGYLEEELRSKWKRVADPLLDPIYKEMEACESLEEFYRLLPELAEKIDGNELLKLIATAQFKLEEVNSNA